MKKTLTFVYGVVGYLVFFGTFLYAIGFIGNFGVPKTMDSPAEGSFRAALLIDSLLLALFVLQHSIMARPAFKRIITRYIPEAAERSTYVLASSLALLLLFWQWRPLGGVVWHAEGTVTRALLHGGYGFGLALVLFSTFLINHFDLFGLRQVWRNFQGQQQSKLTFSTPLLYRFVRHPLYVGWFMTFWFTPTMTATHLFFAVMTTAYILIAIRFEERDLLAAHPEYKAYRESVPMLIPNFSSPEVPLGAVAARDPRRFPVITRML